MNGENKHRFVVPQHVRVSREDALTRHALRDAKSTGMCMPE